MLETHAANSGIICLMQKYYVYILQCNDDTYYTGITNDYVRRFEEHQSGHAENSYTYSRRPLELVYVAAYRYVLDAIAREKQIKGWSKEKKEALIKRNLHLLPVLAKRRNPFKKKSPLSG